MTTTIIITIILFFSLLRLTYCFNIVFIRIFTLCLLVLRTLQTNFPFGTIKCYCIVYSIAYIICSVIIIRKCFGENYIHSKTEVAMQERRERSQSSRWLISYIISPMLLKEILPMTVTTMTTTQVYNYM